MNSNLPNYSLEKSGDYDSTGSYRVNILTDVDGLVERQLAGYVRPILRGFGRARQWQAIVDGVPIGQRMRTRQLAAAVLIEQWKRDHS
ncbi:MAG: hypothetical protein GEV10_13755 [Streptosporangiales bacterium]|nr:hypothetical protein [Streptosporangiales bacterium]